MAQRSPRTRALLSLFKAHGELTKVEWMELQRNLISAAVWAVFAVLSGLVGWLAINAAVVIAFRNQPLIAVGGVIGFNFLVAIVGALQVRRYLRRPAFPLTRSEATRDVHAILETVL